MTHGPTSKIVVLIALCSLSLCRALAASSGQDLPSPRHVSCVMKNEHGTSHSVCRLGEMDFREKVIIDWEMQNERNIAVKFRAAVDCACMTVVPEKVEIEPFSSLRGILTYSQPTLGTCRRIVSFTTEQTVNILEIQSTKARDQYVDPTLVQAKDGFTIEWGGVYPTHTNT